jgi:glycosyltransferase involved in cell wall biosynthesis
MEDVSLHSTDSPDSDRETEAEQVAILIPCFNEEAAIGRVVRDFHAALPGARVYVYDNNSTDRTREEAAAAGALLGRETRQGKGHVIRTMFREVEAAIYVLVDGDDTYSARDVGRLIAPIREGRADMVVASRLRDHHGEAFHPLRLIGNRAFTALFNWLFSARLSDMLSGYRALSRDVVKSIPIVSGGFDIETELTIRALEGGFRIAEVPLPYGKRPQGSQSKLRTIPDGLRVLRRMLLAGRRGRVRGALAAAFLLAAAAALFAGAIALLE